MKLKRSIIKATQYFIGDLWKSKDGSVQMNLSGAKANSALNFNADKQAYYPSNIEEISFEFRDVAQAGQQYILDLKAYFGYKVVGVSLQTDTGTITAKMQINGSDINGLSACAVNSVVADFEATSLNIMQPGNQLKLIISALTNATAIIGKVKTVRL